MVSCVTPFLLLIVFYSTYSFIPPWTCGACVELYSIIIDIVRVYVEPIKDISPPARRSSQLRTMFYSVGNVALDLIVPRLRAW